jgi:hypothetical protein
MKSGIGLRCVFLSIIILATLPFYYCATTAPLQCVSLPVKKTVTRQENALILLDKNMEVKIYAGAAPKNVNESNFGYRFGHWEETYKDNNLIALQPGPYTFLARIYKNTSSTFMLGKSVKMDPFHVESGHVYLLDAIIDKQSKNWRCEIRDVTGEKKYDKIIDQALEYQKTNGQLVQ